MSQCKRFAVLSIFSVSATVGQSRKVILLALVLLSFLGQQGFGQGCTEPPEGMAGWWPGDGDTQDIWNGNNGSLQDGATYAAGKVGQAFSLAPGAFVTVPNAAALNPTSQITIDAWINVSEILFSADPIVKKAGEGSSQENGYALEFNGDSVRFWVYVINGGWIGSPTSPPVEPGSWVHVAGVYDGAGVGLYFNGTSVGPATPATGAIVPSSNDLNIGADPSNLDRHYYGQIDEVEIFDRALTAGEISAIYSAGAAGKCKIQEIAVDVKPASYPNCFNNDGHGVIPVAILGSAAFDVNQIDRASISFQGLQVRRKGNGDAQCSITDVSGDFSSGPAGAPDGFDDLVCQFVDEDGLWEAGSAWAEVSGELLDGTRFAGIDSICITQ